MGWDSGCSNACTCVHCRRDRGRFFRSSRLHVEAYRCDITARGCGKARGRPGGFSIGRRTERVQVQIHARSTRRAITLQASPAPVPGLPQTRERFADATIVNRERSLKPFLAWLVAQDVSRSTVSPVVAQEPTRHGVPSQSPIQKLWGACRCRTRRLSRASRGGRHINLRATSRCSKRAFQPSRREIFVIHRAVAHVLAHRIR